MVEQYACCLENGNCVSQPPGLCIFNGGTPIPDMTCAEVDCGNIQCNQCENPECNNTYTFTLSDFGWRSQVGSLQSRFLVETWSDTMTRQGPNGVACGWANFVSELIPAQATNGSFVTCSSPLSNGSVVVGIQQVVCENGFWRVVLSMGGIFFEFQQNGISLCPSGQFTFVEATSGGGGVIFLGICEGGQLTVA
jgi:hypothetical protein